MNRKLSDLETREWKTASASQIKVFTTCQAKWWFEKIAGVRGEGSGAMERGTLVHAILEHETVHGRRPTPEHVLGMLDDYPLFLEEYLGKHGNDKRRLVTWLLQIAAYASPFLPDEPVPPTYAERGFTLTDPELPVPVVGYIDLLEPDDRGISDYKVRSTGRYALSPEQLKEDPQTALYAAVLQAIHDADPKATKQTERGFMTSIAGPKFADGYFRHLNLCMKENEGRESRLEYTAEEAEKMYREHIVAPIKQMAEVAKILDPRELTPNPGACKMYGRTCINYNLCAQAGHVEPRELDLIMSAFDITDFMAKKRSSEPAQEPKERLTGINPPGGVGREENPSANEYDAKYAQAGPYFPDGERLSDFRKVQLRGKLGEVFQTLTDAEKARYRALTDQGEDFDDTGRNVEGLRAMAVAMIRAWAGSDEARCRKCAVDLLEGEPVAEPEPMLTQAIEPVLTQAIEPVLTKAQPVPMAQKRLALIGCYAPSLPVADFRAWSASMRATMCEQLKVADLGDLDYANGYKAFAAALRSASTNGLDLPANLYMDPLDPLVPHVISWLNDNYVVIRG